MSAITDSLARFDEVIDYAAENAEPFGYFAVIHHAATSAVAANLYRFEDVDRIQRFTSLFSDCYFEAVDGYLNGWQRPGWAGVFDHDLSVLECVELGINSHVVWDLGFVLAELGDLDGFRADFDTFHRVSLPVFPAAWAGLDVIVPRAKWLRRAATVGFWPWLFNHFRARSWRFAQDLLSKPECTQELCANQLAYTKRIDARWRAVLAPFAAGECRDVARNIGVLKAMVLS